MEQEVIGGIEGGATKTTVVLLDSAGNVLCTVVGPGTNHYLLGMTECRKRISDMVNSAKREAGIGEHVPLTALGLGLSGCEQEETNQILIQGFLEMYPNLSEKYAVKSDTVGSIACISNKGGITCIAGTGSNTVLINPDGSKVQCGGWGHLLGDEGSAWSISHKAIKCCFDELDSFAESPHSTEKVWKVIKEHFDIESQMDLLPHFYTNFDKPFIASLCKKLSSIANEGDELSKFIFKQSGENLARALAAVIVKASPDLYNAKGALQALCVGSVWLSWNLLKDGFVSWMDNHTNIKQLSLVKVTATMAIGPAYMVADELNIDLPRNYKNNYEEFYTYTKKTS